MNFNVFNICFFALLFIPTTVIGGSVIDSCLVQPAANLMGERRDSFSDITQAIAEADCAKYKSSEDEEKAFVQDFEGKVKAGLFNQMTRAWYQDLANITIAREHFRDENINTDIDRSACRSDSLMNYARENKSCGEKGIEAVQDLLQIDIDVTIKKIHDSYRDDGVIDNEETREILKIFKGRKSVDKAKKIILEREVRKFPKSSKLTSEKRDELEFLINNDAYYRLVSNGNVDTALEIINNSRNVRPMAKQRFLDECRKIRDNFVKICKEVRRTIVGEERVDLSESEFNYSIDFYRESEEEMRSDDLSKYACLKMDYPAGDRSIDIDELFREYTNRKYNYQIYDIKDSLKSLNDNDLKYFGLNDPRRLEQLLTSLRNGNSVVSSLTNLGSVGHQQAYRNGANYHNVSQFAPNRSGMGSVQTMGSLGARGVGHRGNLPPGKNLNHAGALPKSNYKKGQDTIYAGGFLPEETRRGDQANRGIVGGAAGMPMGPFAGGMLPRRPFQQFPRGAFNPQERLKQIDDDVVNLKKERKEYLLQMEKDRKRLRELRKSEDEKDIQERGIVRERYDNNRRRSQEVDSEIRRLEEEKRAIKRQLGAPAGGSAQKEEKENSNRSGSGSSLAYSGGSVSGQSSGFKNSFDYDRTPLPPRTLNLSAIELGQVYFECVGKDEEEVASCEYQKIIDSFNKKRKSIGKGNLKGEESIKIPAKEKGVYFVYKVDFVVKNGKKVKVVKKMKVDTRQKKKVKKPLKEVNRKSLPAGESPKKKEKKVRKYRASTLEEKLGLP